VEITDNRRKKTRTVIEDSDTMLPRFFVEELDEDDPEEVQFEDGCLKTPEQSRRAPSTNRDSGYSSGSARRQRREGPRDNVRKRILNPSKWKSNVAKEAYNSGMEHVTPRGYKRNARVMKPPCHSSCTKCKARRLTEEERAHIFNHFWKKLVSTQAKRMFIKLSVKCSQPKTLSTLPEKARKTSRTYSFTVNRKEVKVCKTTFLNTLAICDSWVETTIAKSSNGNGLSPEKRGKHLNRPHRYGPETVQSVKDHINTFPRVMSHYCRERTKREYLETGLNQEKMYRMYCSWADQKGIAKLASLAMYKNIFNREYNLGFFMPKKDQCEVCKRWKTALNQEERAKMVQEYSLHLSNKKAVCKYQKTDKAAASKTKCMAAFDLQKVLICPRSETSVMYYKSKLSIFNFTIWDENEKEGHCYLWNETEGQKGANEVATNVYDFIQKKVKDGTQEFFFYSDGPTGQNKNRMVFSMYLTAAQKFNVKITHRFLEPGHTWSPADSIHARIETEAKDQEIFSPEEWMTLILNAKVNGKPYRLNIVTHDNILDFHYLVNRQDWTRDSMKRTVYWSQVREIVCDGKHPNVVFYRYNFSEELSKVKVVLKTDLDINTQDYTPPKAYNSRFPLAPNKAKDLRWLMQKKAIPTKYHGVFEELLSVK
jgi:hypothetical protein